MIHPADTVEPKALWLSRSIIRVYQVAKDTTHMPKVEVVSLTLKLLRSIEAEEFPVPTVSVTGQGSIRLVWTVHERKLAAYVTVGGRIRVYREFRERGISTATLGRDGVDRFRVLVEWLCPGSITGRREV